MRVVVSLAQLRERALVVPLVRYTVRQNPYMFYEGVVDPTRTLPREVLSFGYFRRSLHDLTSEFFWSGHDDGMYVQLSGRVDQRIDQSALWVAAPR